MKGEHGGEPASLLLRAVLGLALILSPGCGRTGDPGHRPTDVPDTTFQDCIPRTWFADGDGDAWGDRHDSRSSCTQPPGYLADGGDCDPTDADVYPGAPEHCDGVDHDCDGLTMDDDPDSIEQTEWFTDADGDGFGAGTSLGVLCTAPAGTVGNTGDCDDTRADVNPDAAEVCEEQWTDEDCDGEYDEPGAAGGDPWWPDADGDGFGDATVLPEWLCDRPAGWVDNDGDCADGDPASPSTWFMDVDADDHGDPATAFLGCLPWGNSAVGDDCDDLDPAVHPGAPETDCTSGLDANCDGALPEADQDHDGARGCEDCDDQDPAVAGTCDTGAP